jgi:hypothetical protein
MGANPSTLPCWLLSGFCMQSFPCYSPSCKRLLPPPPLKRCIHPRFLEPPAQSPVYQPSSSQLLYSAAAVPRRYRVAFLLLLPPRQGKPETPSYLVTTAKGVLLILVIQRHIWRHRKQEMNEPDYDSAPTTTTKQVAGLTLFYGRAQPALSLIQAAAAGRRGCSYTCRRQQLKVNSHA